MADVREARLGRGVLDVVPSGVDVDVRGEVYTTPADFGALEDGNWGRLANARNTAAGGLKNKDPKEVAKRLLRFVAYECLGIPPEVVRRERERRESKRELRAGSEGSARAVARRERLALGGWPVTGRRRSIRWRG